MTLRKPKYDNFSKLGFKIDRLNQSRNTKNISNIEYSQTEFDLLLYHIYSKPFSSCLSKPAEEVDKNSPTSLQEQNIVYNQMNQYLSNLKELRGELTDSKQLQKQRFKNQQTTNDDQLYEQEDYYQYNKVNKFQQDSKNRSISFQTPTKINNLQGSVLKTQQLILNEEQQTKRNSINKIRKILKLDNNVNNQQSDNCRSKTEQSYFSETSSLDSYRPQNLPKIFNKTCQKVSADGKNKKYMDMFYGTQQSIKKAEVEDRQLKEDLEELIHKNKNIQEQKLLKNEIEKDSIQLNHSNSAKKKFVENANNIQYYDKIIPQNASLTRNPQAYNSVIKDAMKIKIQRLKGENSESMDQEFEKKILYKIRSPSHKVERRGGLIDNIFSKQSKDKLKPVDSSTIQSNVSPQKSPTRKEILQEKVAQVLENFHQKSTEMHYYIQKSKAFINRELNIYDSSSSDSEEEDEIDNNQESSDESETIQFNEEEIKQNKIQSRTNIEQGNQYKSQQATERSSKFKASISPKKQSQTKIFNKSYCSSIAGSFTRIDKKNNCLSPKNRENFSPTNKQNYKKSTLSPRRISLQMSKNVSIERRIQIKEVDDDENASQPPPKLKLYQQSPTNIMQKYKQLQYNQDTILNSDQNTIAYQVEPSTFKNIKQNQFNSPKFLDKLSKYQIDHETPLNQQNKLQQINQPTQKQQNQYYKIQLKQQPKKLFPLNNYKQKRGNSLIETPESAALSPNRNNKSLVDNAMKKTQNLKEIQQNKKKNINFDLSFSSQYEKIQEKFNTDKKYFQNSSNSPSNNFVSAKKKILNDLKPKLKTQQESFLSLEKFDSSFLQSEQQDTYSPKNNKKRAEERVKLFIDKKNKIYPKMNWQKYSKESALLSKMEDLSTKADSIKEQFQQISRKFKKEIIDVKTDNKDDVENYLNVFEHEDESKTSQNKNAKSDVKIFDDKEKINNIIKSIEKDSINLLYYINVEEQLNQQQKKNQDELEIKNIKAYHLIENSLQKKN